MESAEHAWIGDQITLEYETGRVAARGWQLNTGPGPLTYGQLIALGGDFYGVVGAPISTSPDPQAAFIAAFATLTSSWADTPRILQIMDKEITAVNKAISEGKEPSLAYFQLGDSLSKEWNRATGGGSVLYDFWPMGRYLALAAENWDHFANYAVLAYSAGHKAAMTAARWAAQGGSPQERRARLDEAYAMNAFADHFLTDLFSAGHLRAPRKELYDQVTTPFPTYGGVLGSLLSRCMHDEDCRYGLNVRNIRDDRWVAYGDKRLLDSVSAANRDLVTFATQVSADEVWRAYQNLPDNYGALDVIPVLDRFERQPEENYSPLFKVLDGVVAKRNDVASRQDYSWTTDWVGWGAYAELCATHEYRHAACYLFESGQFVGWLGASWDSYVRLEMDETRAHGMRWAFKDGDLYLRKDTTPTDRDLGIAKNQWACWGLGGGYREPVRYYDDLTISRVIAPTKLHLGEGGFARWSTRLPPDPATLLRVVLPLEAPGISC